MSAGLRYTAKRLIPYIWLFIGLESLKRLILTLKEDHLIDSTLASIFKSFGAGLILDIAVLPYLLIPVAASILAIPKQYHGKTIDKIVHVIVFSLFCFTLLFTGLSEWFFWDEFSSRFNFIAVDYLVYTHEVIGNIMESYPVIPLVSTIAIISIMIGGISLRRDQFRIPQCFTGIKRFGVFILICGLSSLSFYVSDPNIAKVSPNRYTNEIASNGIYNLFHAFRNNELSYDQFYLTENSEVDLHDLRKKLRSTGTDYADPFITRNVKADGQEHRYNIMLVTVESLGADFLKRFGNQNNITPHLDRLINESLFFDNFYAIGTRTVYGLTAITLSIPPVPGNAIARRTGNEGLFSLASVLNKKGYDSRFIYGGYGYFDNMNYFFANNGYQVIDRHNMTKDEISFANVWGVADEDLFNKVLKESDKSYVKGKPFFNMIMTTSNHRPYTYPEGRIDLPSKKSGRHGGVKYTDFAINEFIQAAKKKPWFKDTIFVIVADHTAGSAGKTELDPTKYHIPCIVYAPEIIKPQVVSKLASQIDLAPTLLGLLNMNYQSRFYGENLLKQTPQRAFISNYQQLGYLTKDKLVILKPMQQVDYYERIDGEFTPVSVSKNPAMVNDAIDYYQGASRWKSLNKAL